MAFADVRTYSMATKMHVPRVRTTMASQSKLLGHFIDFVHIAAQVLDKYFEETLAENVLDNVRLVFVGAADKITQLERHALSLKGMRLRPHLLYRQAMHSPWLYASRNACGLVLVRTQPLAKKLGGILYSGC